MQNIIIDAKKWTAWRKINYAQLFLINNPSKEDNDLPKSRNCFMLSGEGLNPE